MSHTGETRMEITPSPEMTSTYVRVFSDHIYPFVSAGYVIHRKDLSDLNEPYLSAVKAARGNG